MENQDVEIQVQSELTRSKLTNPLSEDFTGRYGGQELTIPAGKTVIMPTVAAKVIGRHLVSQCIIKSFEGKAVREGEVSQATVDQHMREQYNVVVFGEGAEDGNPLKLPSEIQVLQSEIEVANDDVATEPVENWSWPTLKAKAKELDVFDANLKRPGLEKVVKAALEK